MKKFLVCLCATAVFFITSEITTASNDISKIDADKNNSAKIEKGIEKGKECEVIEPSTNCILKDKKCKKNKKSKKILK